MADTENTQIYTLVFILKDMRSSMTIMTLSMEHITILKHYSTLVVVDQYVMMNMMRALKIITTVQQQATMMVPPRTFIMGLPVCSTAMHQCHLLLL